MTAECLIGLCAYGRQAVEGSGPLPADVLLIGEAPGAVELRLGVPFVGRAGALLDTLLERAGLRRAALRVTNTCACVDMEREDRRPLPAELAACRPRLDAEIALCAPRAVILCGNTALQTFYPGFRIGEVYNTPRCVGPFVTVPVYHPAHVLRGHKQVEPLIEEGLRLARRLSE